MKIGLIKMLRDLKLYKGRTILTLIGVLIGMTAMGAILSAYAILNREMNRNFMDTNPASIVFNVSNLDAKAIKLIQESHRNTDVAIRKTTVARVAKGDNTYGIIHLRAIQDFKELQVDTFALEKGSFPTEAFEMALERDCFKVLKNLSNGIGESLFIKLPGGIAKEIQISGIVHAPGLAPASMEHYSYGFLTLAGLKNLGYQGWYDEIRIVCHDGRFNREQMIKVAREIKKTLMENGYLVKRVDVLKPGKHPHASQLNSILFLLQAFTAISLLVACIIIINLLNFIIAKQSKQIAIMKTVGAGISDIVWPYFGYVLIISLIALALSFPIAVLAGSGYSDFAANILNFKIASYEVPFWVFIIQSITGILIPLIAAAYPIFKSSSRCVKDGLIEKAGTLADGDRKNPCGKRINIAINSKIMIPINNLFRKRSRTILAVLALTAGGILFMTSRNIVASIDKTVDASFRSFRWDLDIRLAQNYPQDKLQRVLKKVTGIDNAEIWGSNTMILKKADGTDSANYMVKIIPEKPQLLNHAIADKFKANGSQNPIIVTKALATDEKLKPGTKVRIESNGHIAEVLVTGVVNEVPDFSAAYIAHDTYQKLFSGKFNQNILARARRQLILEQRKNNNDTYIAGIEKVFQSSGIEIAENWNVNALRKAFVDHLRVIVAILSVIAMLAVFVGGLSIGSAVGINISERKREIGVLRAVGVNSYQNIIMVLIEVLLMGIAGWLAAVVLSYPVSVLVGNYFGQIFLNANLQNTLSVSGMLQWLAISVTVSLLSGFIPAWRAATSSLREMLTYE
jgi:putative ABC transport system permease protein